MSKTVRNEWDSYSLQVMDARSGDLQRQELRRAFYAGFSSAVGVITDIGRSLGDDEALVAIRAVRAELLEFGADVTGGRA